MAKETVGYRRQTSAQCTKTCQAATKTDFVPTFVHAYTHDGGAAFDTIYHRIPREGWGMRFNLTDELFQQEDRAYLDAGYARIAHNRYSVGKETCNAAIWHKMPGSARDGGICANHPGTAASFVCSQCQVAYCTTCERTFSDLKPTCAQCAETICMNKYGYCYDCVTQSQSESVGKMGTINAVGSMFYGWDKCCSSCRSRVKTAWLVFAGFPLFPIGSFRVADLGNSQFLSRRVPLHQRQVLATWFIAYVVLVLFLVAWASIDYSAFKGTGVDVIVGCSLIVPTALPAILVHRVLTRLLGGAFFLAFLCFIAVMVAACVGVWLYLDFSHWPEEVRIVCAFLAPLVFVILPGLHLATRFHRSRR